MPKPHLLILLKKKQTKNPQCNSSKTYKSVWRSLCHSQAVQFLQERAQRDTCTARGESHQSFPAEGFISTKYYTLVAWLQVLPSMTYRQDVFYLKIPFPTSSARTESCPATDPFLLPSLTWEGETRLGFAATVWPLRAKFFDLKGAPTVTQLHTYDRRFHPWISLCSLFAGKTRYYQRNILIFSWEESREIRGWAPASCWK